MGKIEKIQKCVEKQKEGPLIKLMSDKDKKVALAAIEAAGKIGKDDAFNALVIGISDDDADIRAASATALGVMKNEHASAHLRYCLENEKDQKVITAIKKAISSLSSIKD